MEKFILILILCFSASKITNYVGIKRTETLIFHLDNPDSSFYSQMPLDKSINVAKENLLTINNDYNNNENSFMNNKINKSQRLDSIKENYYYSITDENNNNNNKLKNKHKNIKRNYIQILNNEKNNFTNEKNKYQKLFDNNDYGYKRSKIKYNYLIEKYF